MRKSLLLVALTAALLAVTGAWGSGKALAYGHADQPLAQVEISANCNNPSYELCQQVGLGGVWAWAEVDNTGDGTSGTMDFTLSECGHTIGGGGPGSAGAGGGPGEGNWYLVDSLADIPDLGGMPFPFFDPSKSYDAYYVLDFFPGSGEDDFIAVVPAAQGHYGFRPVHGATIQTQVAP
jgi:hypothetical protein